MTDTAEPQPPVPAKKPGTPYFKKGYDPRRSTQKANTPGRNPTGKGGWVENSGISKLVKHRKALSRAIADSLTSPRIKALLEKLYEHAMSKDEGWQRSAEMVLERALGKPKVEAEVSVTGEVTIEQRVLVAKMVSGLVINDVLAEFNEPPTIPSVESKQLPFIDSVASERPIPDENVGDLLHPQQSQREVLHREFDPGSDSVDGASVRTECETSQESEATERME